MELYQLRAFVAVAEAGRLTRAAERLHLSQPALSAQIKALEDELGQRLFERAARGMDLTRAGRDLVELARRVLAAAEALKLAARKHQSEPAGRARIGAVSDPQFIRLGEFLARSLELHPLIEIELHSDFTGAAFEAVTAGTLDASFYFGDISHPAVSGLRLADMTYRVAAPAAWAERVRGAQWAEIAAMPWILTPESSTHHHLVHALFQAHGFVPAKVVSADNEGVIANLVESEVGLSLVREDLAYERTRAGALYVWDRARSETALWFIHLTERSRDPILVALLDVVREIWGLEALLERTDAAAPA